MPGRQSAERLRQPRVRPRSLMRRSQASSEELLNLPGTERRGYESLRQRLHPSDDAVRKGERARGDEVGICAREGNRDGHELSPQVVVRVDVRKVIDDD